jgi:phosphatidylserine decarboxylase
MYLTKHGIREWGTTGIIALILIGVFTWFALKACPISGWGLACLTFVIWLAIAAFFRVPNRKIPQAEELIMSPADGVVKDIEELEECDFDYFKGQKVICIGIFLSVLDVHVNRAPCRMKVEFLKYKEGKFFDARDSRCGKENESMTIAGIASVCGKSFPTAIKQISGAIARRIVCPVEKGRELAKGEIYGMIKFGSRTELYLPVDAGIEVKVKIGDRALAGITVMAAMKNND